VVRWNDFIIIVSTLSFNMSFLLLYACHSRKGGNPLWLGRWIPAIVYPRAGGGRACPHEGGGITNSPVAGFLQTS
jgi:hypothetical protein